jgi:hypothetical protein
MLFYLFANIAYLSVLTVDEMVASSAVASVSCSIGHFFSQNKFIVVTHARSVL